MYMSSSAGTPVYTCSCSACSMYTECEHHVPPVPVMVHGGTSRVPDGTSTVLPGYPTVLQKYLSGTWDGTQRYFQSTQQYFRGVSAVLWMVPNGSTVMVNGIFVVSFDAYCTCAVMYLYSMSMCCSAFTNWALETDTLSITQKHSEVKKVM